MDDKLPRDAPSAPLATSADYDSAASEEETVSEPGPLFPKDKKKGPLANLRKYHRDKSNSTSTLYVNSTVSQPDVNVLLHSVAIMLQAHIRPTHMTESVLYMEIFDERLHPLTKPGQDTINVPSIGAVYEYIDKIFTTEKLSPEVAIMSLAYIDRIVELAGISLTPATWRRIVLASMILASKVWEDLAVWNVDFLVVFPCLSAKDLGALEKVLLKLLQFNVTLKASLYTKYYFELRSLAEKDQRTFPLEPLDKDAASKLESRSQAKEESVRTKVSRSKSLNTFDFTKSPPAVLN